MNYTLRSDHLQLRERFLRRFTLSYEAFCQTHGEWLAGLPGEHRNQYTPSYYEKLPYSDRLKADFQCVCFDAALELLRSMPQVLFLTSEPGGLIRDYGAIFGTERLWAAESTGPELAEEIRRDWFEMYALWEQDRYNPQPLFGSEVYAFTPDFRQAVIFTHETDETELPETRICLCLQP